MKAPHRGTLLVGLAGGIVIGFGISLLVSKLETTRPADPTTWRSADGWELQLHAWTATEYRYEDGAFVLSQTRASQTGDCAPARSIQGPAGMWHEWGPDSVRLDPQGSLGVPGFYPALQGWGAELKTISIEGEKHLVPAADFIAARWAVEIGIIDRDDDGWFSEPALQSVMSRTSRPAKRCATESKDKPTSVVSVGPWLTGDDTADPAEVHPSLIPGEVLLTLDGCFGRTYQRAVIHDRSQLDEKGTITLYVDNHPLELKYQETAPGLSSPPLP